MTETKGSKQTNQKPGFVNPTTGRIIRHIQRHSLYFLYENRFQREKKQLSNLFYTRATLASLFIPFLPTISFIHFDDRSKIIVQSELLKEPQTLVPFQRCASGPFLRTFSHVVATFMKDSRCLVHVSRSVTLHLEPQCVLGSSRNELRACRIAYPVKGTYSALVVSLQTTLLLNNPHSSPSGSANQRKEF